jgi:hypothetical protein
MQTTVIVALLEVARDLGSTPKTILREYNIWRVTSRIILILLMFN